MFDFTKHGDISVIKLNGDLNISNSMDFKDWIISEFLDKKIVKILLDMSDIKSLDSFALGVLIGIYKRVILAGGRLCILSPNENIKRLFEITGMDKLLKIYNTLSEALSEMR
ncbi:MAG TPA: STAS domain-containing protein [Fervidobacterium nodosum]|nr:STAS domain-containing protein [Fervidobacterium nodosum]